MGGLRRSRSALARILQRQQNQAKDNAQEVMKRLAGFPHPVTVGAKQVNTPLERYQIGQWGWITGASPVRGSSRPGTGVCHAAEAR